MEKSFYGQIKEDLKWGVIATLSCFERGGGNCHMGHLIAAIFILSHAYMYMWIPTFVILKVFGGINHTLLFFLTPLRNACHIEMNEWIDTW